MEYDFTRNNSDYHSGSSVTIFFGGIATFIFKKIVIDPLKEAINSFDVTIQKLEKSTNKQLDIHDKEIEFLKLKTTRHDEQLKTLFGKRESV